MQDKPTTVEEKLVVDADTLTRLGLLGLVRQVAMAAAAGESIEATLDNARRSLAGRTFTPAAHTEAAGLRDQLRDLLRELDQEIDRK
jgi:hypothetical protein